jgi:arylsulfatase B
MATFDHTPAGRGYVSSFGYFNHANDYWSELAGDAPYKAARHCTGSAGVRHSPVDLWDTDAPAATENGTAHVGSVQGYEEYKFQDHVLSVIDAHNPSVPLFLNYDMHVIHAPMQAPDVYLSQFDFIAHSSCGDHTGPEGLGNRQTYAAMVRFADDVLLNVTGSLRAKGMWDKTLMFVQSDNGGPSFAGATFTANNYPLKGTKTSNW